MKYILFVIGGLLALYLCVVSIYFLLTIFNPYAETYSIKGKILNYNLIKNEKPTEVMLEICLGNPFKWDEKFRILIYQIDSDGSFTIDKIEGYNLNLDFRSNNNIYTYGEILSTNNDLIIDLNTLKQGKRYFDDEEDL